MREGPNGDRALTAIDGVTQLPDARLGERAGSPNCKFSLAVARLCKFSLEVLTANSPN